MTTSGESACWRLLLTNEGLLRAVQLAPESAWREALAQVYDH